MRTVKDFENTGYSFVAKKNNEVVGVIMAQKIMDYGSYHIFVNNYAVKASMQGMGIGKQLMEHLIGVAKENKIHKIMLHTEKNLKLMISIIIWGLRTRMMSPYI